MRPPRQAKRKRYKEMSGCLSQELIDRSREQFRKYEDSEQTGKINVWDVGDVLENMNGEKVLDEVLLQMISEVDRNLSGYIDFFQLLTLVETYEKWKLNTSDHEGNDLLTAYIACGGDRSRLVILSFPSFRSFGALLLIISLLFSFPTPCY